MSTNLDRRVLLGMAGIAGAAVVSRAASAGSLNPPPGPVAPTGKSTDQIEPRIDLLNAPASANVTSDASNHYIINNPGSYYLSANLAVTKNVGIMIAAQNVSLDLCGFQIAGSGTSTSTGIVAGGNCAWIGNGSLASLQIGLDDPGTAAGCTLSHLRSTQCSQYGLRVPVGSTVQYCVAEHNAGVGIYAANYCSLTDCTAESNADLGFSANEAITFARCKASRNTAGGFRVFGDSVLTDCTATLNGTSLSPASAGISCQIQCVLSRCNSSDNYARYGFDVGYTCVLTDCIAGNNYGSTSGNFSGGIRAAGSCRISGCLAVANQGGGGMPTAGAGISVGVDCRIEDCQAISNDGNGIIVDGAGCVLTGCGSNSNRFDGIAVNAGSTSVVENQCAQNGASGIHVQSGSATVVERNHLLDNVAIGLQIDSTVCFAFGNLARSNPTNYSIVAGNRIGQIVVMATNASAISGNSGGVAVTTDPYCNIAF